MPDEAKTIYLGQYHEPVAEEIAAALVAAGIAWWHKSANRLVQMISSADWGVRMFAEETRIDEARAIADRIDAAHVAKVRAEREAKNASKADKRRAGRRHDKHLPS